MLIRGIDISFNTKKQNIVLFNRFHHATRPPNQSNPPQIVCPSMPWFRPANHSLLKGVDIGPVINANNGTFPRCSMYGTYLPTFYHQNYPNVGNLAIHGASGILYLMRINGNLQLQSKKHSSISRIQPCRSRWSLKESYIDDHHLLIFVKGLFERSPTKSSKLLPSKHHFAKTVLRK